MTDATITAIFVALGSIATIGAQIYRENRNRKWEIEDRDRRAKEVATQNAATAQEVAKKVEQSHQEIVSAIAENTQLTNRVAEQAASAFSEANHLNKKIALLGTDVKMQLVKANEKIEKVITENGKNDKGEIDGKVDGKDGR